MFKPETEAFIGFPDVTGILLQLKAILVLSEP
jgi:hypothetical protein